MDDALPLNPGSTPDLFGDVAPSLPAADASRHRRVRPHDEAIRAAIDKIRGSAPVASVSLGRLSAEVGGSKAYLRIIRDAYAFEMGEDVLSETPDRPTFDTIGPLLSLSPDRLRQHPVNPRIVSEDDADFLALADSIRQEGQRVPILVVVDPERADHFLIVDGSRRCRAMNLLYAEGIPRPIQTVLMDTEDPMGFLIDHVAHARNWSDYERALFFTNACARSQETQALLATRSGLTASGFVKAMAPARLPPEMLERIIDLREIRVSDADRAFRNWKKNEPAVRGALFGLDGPLAARALLDLCTAAGQPIPTADKPIKLPAAVTRLQARARQLLKTIDVEGVLPTDVARLRELVVELARIGAAGTAR